MKPYLSIVATSRNDNHGGELLKRMQIFISGLVTQSERYKLPIELIIVEWNPVKDEKKLYEVLNSEVNHAYCTIKYIEVSNELHNKYADPESKMPLYQMIGKNVGIRRAKGEFVLATNIDILFSNILFEFLAKKELKKDVLYRATRYDIEPNIGENDSLDEWIKFAENNIVRENKLHGSKMVKTREYHEIFKDNLKQGDLRHGCMAVLFTNACGDFQLLHRDMWEKIRAYPEWAVYSFHLDTIFEYSAHFLGAKEFILPETYRIYHIEHGGGFKTDNENEMNNIIKARQSKRILDVELEFWMRMMTREKRGFIFNDTNWGLANEEVTEVVFKKDEK